MNRGVFQKLHNMRYGNRLAVEADKKMQLFSIKQELKRFAEVQNSATLCTFCDFMNMSLANKYLYLVNFFDKLFCLKIW